MSLQLHNIEASDGTVSVSFASSGAVSVEESALRLEMKQGEKSFHNIPIAATSIGIGRWTMSISGPDNIHLKQMFEISVRPAQTVQSRRFVVQVGAGSNLSHPLSQKASSFTATSDLLTGFLPETSTVSMMLGAGAGFDLPRLVKALHRYPYGCLEQTISTTMPLLYLSELADYIHVDAKDRKLKAAVEHGIRRLATMQRYDGSFGYWDARGGPQPWLTVYALDFMSRARRAGFAVPDTMYNETISWFSKRALRRGSELFNLRTAEATRAYALYVLAKAGHPEPSLLRYWNRRGWVNQNPLEAQLLLTASTLTGVLSSTHSAADPTAGRDRDWESADYGSKVRDAAMRLTLMLESRADDRAILDLADTVNRLMTERRYLSTQEMAWLALAGKAMIARYGAVDVAVGGRRIKQDRPLAFRVSPDELARGVTIENKAADLVLATVMVSGIPDQPMPAEENGFSVRRMLYDLNGKLVGKGHPLQQGERYVVILDGGATASGQQQSMVVDMLPAGLEIENTRLLHGGSLKDFGWLGDITKGAHLELRDDRFVAAFELKSGHQDYKVAYIVRAVTSGSYVWPAAYVEDMYRPDRFARGAIDRIEVAGR